MAVKTATWKFAVTSLPTAVAAAAVVDYLEKPLDALYTRRRNSYNELMLEIENRNDIHALNAAGYRRCILGIRNNVVRLHGQITEHTETSRGFQIVAKDPYYNMAWRRFWTGPPTGFTYTSLGDAEIAMRLIEKTDADYISFLKRGTIQSGANRTRKFEIGDKVSEKVEYLASLANAFAFTIDGTFGTVGELAKFNAYSPYDVLMPKARFEYGQDTLNNVVDYKRIMLPLVNRINVVGRYGGTTYAEWVAGRNTYGLWEDERGSVDIDETNAANTTTLQEIAASYVQHEPQYSLDLTPGPDAPQLFTDFDVTNTVPVLIKNFGIERSMTRSVREVAVRLDPASGVENIETLSLNDPDEL